MLEELKNNSKFVQKAGYLALLIGFLGIVWNHDLSISSKVGQLSTALFAFASTSMVIAAAFSVAGTILAAVIGIIFASFITWLITAFNSLYFSHFSIKTRKNYLS